MDCRPPVTRDGEVVVSDDMDATSTNTLDGAPAKQNFLIQLNPPIKTQTLRRPTKIVRHNECST